MPAVGKRRWTRAEVLELIAQNPLHTPRHEVVDGELFVTPSPNGPHQIAVLLLASLLRSYVRQVGIGEARIPPFDVELEPGTWEGSDVGHVSAPTVPATQGESWEAAASHRSSV